MFLEYAIWGAWSVVAGKSFQDMGFNGNQMGWIFSLLPLATIITPFFGGQIADRYLNTEKFLAILHLIGGAVMLALATKTSYHMIVVLMLIYSLFYAPTLALTNSITFHHLTSSEREFGGIRVGGTVGWVAAGWILALWRWGVGHPIPGDLFYLAGILSILLGLFCFCLPKTPPKREGANPLAFVEALVLLKNFDFLFFIIISFVVGTELQFYYMLTPQFLAAPTHFGGIGLSENSLSFVMSVAQIAEFSVMLSLPFFLLRLGVRKTLVVGILAWPIRYAIFAFLPIAWLVIPALALHGFCYVFFFVVGFIYVDKVAPADIRASAQSLVALVVLGMGSFVGSKFAGYIQNIYTKTLHPAIIWHNVTVNQVTNWHLVFLIPCALTVACAIIFPLLFHERQTAAPEVQGA